MSELVLVHHVGQPMTVQKTDGNLTARPHADPLDVVPAIWNSWLRVEGGFATPAVTDVAPGRTLGSSSKAGGAGGGTGL